MNEPQLPPEDLQQAGCLPLPCSAEFTQQDIQATMIVIETHLPETHLASSDARQCDQRLAGKGRTGTVVWPLEMRVFQGQRSQSEDDHPLRFHKHGTIPHQTDTESPQSVAEAESVVGVASTVLFAFFRDKDCAANLKDGRDHYAAGIITGRWATNSASGKDLSVTYLDPFTGYVESCWREDGEIVIYPVDEWEWKSLKERYEAIEANM